MPDQPPAVSHQCEVEGCLASIESGDALHRTSPFGEQFRGRCTKHFREMGREPDRVACIIEDHNHSQPCPPTREGVTP